MKRHESLQDLSRDHYYALVQSQQVRKAIEGAEDALSPDKAAKELLAFYEREGLHHFDEEEQVLLPILGRHVNLDEDPMAQRLLTDHEWLRRAFAELRRRLDADEDYDDLLADLGARLHDHARFEEDELFPRMQRELGTADLGQIHEASREFRLRTRGETAIGPARHAKKDSAAQPSS